MAYNGREVMAEVAEANGWTIFPPHKGENTEVSYCHVCNRERPRHHHACPLRMHERPSK